MRSWLAGEFFYLNKQKFSSDCFKSPKMVGKARCWSGLYHDWTFSPELKTGFSFQSDVMERDLFLPLHGKQVLHAMCPLTALHRRILFLGSYSSVLTIGMCWSRDQPLLPVRTLTDLTHVIFHLCE